MDLVITSPPYWALRDYGVQGQMGLEPSPREYLAKLLEIFGEVRRVLKPAGSCYVDLGDTYYRPPKKGGSGAGKLDSAHETYPRRREARPPREAWLQPKQLLLIPYRFAIGMQEQGWILRNVVAWFKPNHMPGPVRDRLTNSWEPIFHFVKSRHYYYDLDSIREPHTSPAKKKEGTRRFVRPDGFAQAPGHVRHPLGKNPGDVCETKWSPDVDSGAGRLSRPGREHVATHPIGRNPGDVAYGTFDPEKAHWKGLRDHRWSFYSRIHGYPPLPNPKGKHPKDVAEAPREIEAQSVKELLDSGANLEPGTIINIRGKRYVLVCQRNKSPEGRTGAHEGKEKWKSRGWQFEWRLDRLDGKNPRDVAETPGDFWRISTRPFRGAHFAVFPEAICVRPIKSSCPPGGVVLDPFAGSGTVAKVARDLGRSSISIDLNPAYLELWKRRLNVDQASLGNVRYEWPGGPT